MTSLDVAVAVPTVRLFADRAVDALGEARAEIDELNVYPVPDGDTGTNLYLTMVSARDALAEADDAGQSTPGTLQAFARGALLGARGNSGVILSQLVGGLVARLRRARNDEDPAVVFAEGLREATDASYLAVGTPVEGTILSVARAAADAARLHAHRTLSEVVSAAATAAHHALARTPDQLPVLQAAGVVDAGGRGLCVLLDVAEEVLSGAPPRAVRRAPATAAAPAAAEICPEDHHATPGGPAFEVMYLLDADDAAVPTLRERLAALGDSLVVVGGDGLWNVHVHVDEAGPAIEAGLAAGHPHRIRVTHLGEQVAARRTPARGTTGRAVVSVSAGPGLAATFAAAGAMVVEAAVGERPSVGMLLDAVRATGAAEVVLLPNDRDTRRTAQLAADAAEEDGDRAVAVVPTDAQVQGLAALAVHDASRPFEHDVREMTATARHARHGALTVAARRAITSAGPCEPGDVLGVVGGDFVLVGDDRETVALAVVERLLGAGGDLVTLVAGADDAGLTAAVAARVEAAHPLVDVVVYDGGQARYPLLVSVE